MNRRECITLLGAAATWPPAANAQQAVRRVATLDVLTEDDLAGRAQIAAFRSSLQTLGWSDRHNIYIDEHWASNRDRAKANVEEMMRRPPDIILARSYVVPLLQHIRSIPIVFVGGSDPVAEGIVLSLARPGGNITGFSNNSPVMATKRLQLLKEIAPRVARVAYIYDPGQPGSAEFLAELQAAVSSFVVQLSAKPVHDAAEIEHTFDILAREPDGGLFVYAGGVTNTHRDLIIALTRRHSLPAVYGFRYFVVGGGLLSYGVDVVDQYRRAASYVDRILKGEKPNDLPVQQPTKFEFVINLRTAKALGLTVPDKLLALADEVIE